jgi:hypothetical protein
VCRRLDRGFRCGCARGLGRALAIGAALASLCWASSARAEFCWDYVDGNNALTPVLCVAPANLNCANNANFDINTVSPTCDISPPAPMTGTNCCCTCPNPFSNSAGTGDCSQDSTACTSRPPPPGRVYTQTVLDMHAAWHNCFGGISTNPNTGRSARWLAFHRQFELDFDLFRERVHGCSPGSGGDKQGCFIQKIDWFPGMTMGPQLHQGGAGLTSGQHPRGCGTGPNRPDNVVCETCAPLPQCMFRSSAGPMGAPVCNTAADCPDLPAAGGPPLTCVNNRCVVGGCGGPTVPSPINTYDDLDDFQSIDELALVLDTEFHSRMHTNVSQPFVTDCNTLAPMECTTHPGSTCQFVGNRSTCVYNRDLENSRCSPRDSMFWRLHKELDQVGRAWQTNRPTDVMVVLDHSGSMGELDSSGRPKMDMAKEAAQMFADLLEQGQNYRMGINSFANGVTPDMPLTSADDPNFLTTVGQELGAIAVGGCTSIGSGLQGAVQQLCNGSFPDPVSGTTFPSCSPVHGATFPPSMSGGPNQRKAVVLLTDGMENRPPCLLSQAAAQTGDCGGVCGGTQLPLTDVLGPRLQLCAVGFGQAGSLNTNLLTLLAEQQGGIYMQSPAAGTDGTWIDLKDFYVKCMGQISDSFVGLDPKGVIGSTEMQSDPSTYSSCDDSKLTFVGGWRNSGALRLMVNAPSGRLVRPATANESSLASTYNFFRVQLPHQGEAPGGWRSQLIRPHNSYVNGFTTDSLASNVAVPLVRRQIQRLCPNGCAQVLYFEDGRLGARSSYDDALAAELATGLIGSVTRVATASDFADALLGGGTFDLIVYAHQMTFDAEPYDIALRDRLCNTSQRAIVTETRTTTGSGEFVSDIPIQINRCSGANPDGTLNWTTLSGDGRLFEGTFTLGNPGYTRVSYGLANADPPTGRLHEIQGFNERPDVSEEGGQSGAVAAEGQVLGSDEPHFEELLESPIFPPAERWFTDVLVKGGSRLSDQPMQAQLRTGRQGLLASVEVMTPDIPLGGWDNVAATVEVQSPLAGNGIGQTLINIGPQASTATPTADGLDGRAAALALAPAIPTVTETFVLNDNGTNGDLIARNAVWGTEIPTRGNVDGMYRLHFKADFTKNGCTTRRELVRSLFVDVGVDPATSVVSVAPRPGGGFIVILFPRDRFGNPVGWGRDLKPKCDPSPACSCSSSTITDHLDGRYTVTVTAPPNTPTCSITILGEPISVHTNPACNTDTTPPKFVNLRSATYGSCVPGGGDVKIQPPTATDNCTTPPKVTGRVIRSNGVVNPDPPDALEGSQFLAIGTHVIRWTARDARGNQTSVDQTVFVGPGLFANGFLRMADRSRAVTGLGPFANVGNAGIVDTNIGVETQVGPLLSKASVVVRDRGKVYGTLITSGTLTRHNGTLIGGPILEHAPVPLPPFPALNVTFPPPTGLPISVEPGQTRTLAPGSYRTVSVKSRGTLVLSSSTGSYFFERLNLEPQADVKVNGNPALFIKLGFIHRGRFITSSGSPASVTIGYNGTEAVFLEAPFGGSLLAPKATVTVRAVYTGELYAKNVEVSPDIAFLCKPGGAPVRVLGAHWEEGAGDGTDAAGGEGCGCGTALPGRAATMASVGALLGLSALLGLVRRGRRHRHRRPGVPAG